MAPPALVAPLGPRLTVRAFAQLMNAPARLHAAVLRPQKYPREPSPAGRARYYRDVRAVIPRHFAAGHDPAVAQKRRERLVVDLATTPRSAARARHNTRAIDAFARHPFSKRWLRPVSMETVEAQMRGVAVRVTFDLVAEEGSSRRFFFINFREASEDPEVARQTLEVAHWILEQAGHGVPMGRLEYVDLASGEVYGWSRRRSSIVGWANSAACVVAAMWDDV